MVAEVPFLSWVRPVHGAEIDLTIPADIIAECSI